jgi:hydroxypyruvate isomerase
MNLAANISTLFREVPMLERFRAAREAGFAAVEMQFPYAVPAPDLAAAAAAAGVPVILINAPVIAHTHPFGMAARPDMREAFRSGLPTLQRYARTLGVRFVHVMAGVVRDSADPADCWKTYVENLLLAADALDGLGVQVLVEPLNPFDVPGYALGTLAAAERLIERCRGRVGLQFDAYHVARMGLSPALEFARLSPIVRHVQFADAPGRHEPGSGDVRFGEFLEALHTARYEGWLAAEYTPSTTTAAGLEWLATWRCTS